MFACYVAVSFIDPLLLWSGGKLMSSIFGFGSRWQLGVFIAAGVVGGACVFRVGRQRFGMSTIGRVSSDMGAF
jgi:hypothetical protein